MLPQAMAIRAMQGEIAAHHQCRERGMPVSHSFAEPGMHLIALPRELDQGGRALANLGRDGRQQGLPGRQHDLIDLSTIARRRRAVGTQSLRARHLCDRLLRGTPVLRAQFEFVDQSLTKSQTLRCAMLATWQRTSVGALCP